MAYLSSIKFLTKFDSDITDSISGGSLQAGGFSPASLQSDGAGYRMNQGQYLYMIDSALGITAAFTIGFWIYNVNAGMAQNPSTDALVPMRMPILEIGQGTYDEDTFDYEPDSPSILVYETCHENNQNKLVVAIYPSGGGTAYTATTPLYDAFKWHHFWLSYNTSTNKIVAYVDGVLVTCTETGSGPVSVDGSTAGVWINNDMFSSNYDFMRNYAIIDDIIIQNQSELLASTVARIVNNGVEYYGNTDYEGLDQTEISIISDDPTAVKTTDMIDDGTYVYATRSDGKILRGSPLFWQSRKDYADIEESAVLSKFGTGVEIDNGVLKITNGTVKL